jgi:3,4-dihydroxy 2-butanone 4-phosphate synthase/GTP cyclohydrolase II
VDSNWMPQCERFSQEGLGAVIYLRGHEGRGIGLHAKLHAYALQDTGLDTVEANLRLGLPVDARDYDMAAAILRDLGLRRIRLLSANPHKSAQLSDLGIEITARLPLPVTEHPENAFYLATKRRRMGHDNGRALPDAWRELLHGRVPDRAATATDAVLLERYGPLVAAGPMITIAQLAQSIDGFIALRTGDANYVSGEEDREHLHRLRALVDAVVVGAQTSLPTIRSSRPVLCPDLSGPRHHRPCCPDPQRCPSADRRRREDPLVRGCLSLMLYSELAPHVEVVTLPLENGRFQPTGAAGHAARARSGPGAG